MRETWSRFGMLTESSRFLGNFIPLLRDIKLSLQNLPPLVHPCPYACLLRTVFLSLHQPLAHLGWELPETKDGVSRILYPLCLA